jgi:hypothetical protein
MIFKRLIDTPIAERGPVVAHQGARGYRVLLRDDGVLLIG